MSQLIKRTLAILCAVVAFAVVSTRSFAVADEAAPPTETPKVTVAIDGKAVLPSFGTVAGSWFYNAGPTGSQALLLGFPKGGVEQIPNYRLVADLNSGSSISLTIPGATVKDAVAASCAVKQIGAAPAAVVWSRAGTDVKSAENAGRVEASFAAADSELVLTISAPEFDVANGACAVEITDFRYRTDAAFSLEPTRKPQALEKVETSPDFRPTLADALVVWDWKMQDGIGTEREPRSYREALELRLPQGRALIDDLTTTLDDGSFENLAPYDEKIVENFEKLGEKLDGYRAAWDEFEKRFANLAQSNDEAAAEKLWLDARTFKRQMLLDAPYFQIDSLVFLKHAPTLMSHQLTQVYGYCARPGGGIFRLDAPGKSMTTRDITPKNLPQGAFMTPELSFDGSDLYFAFCDVPTSPVAWRDPATMDRRYHLYKTNVDGADAIQLTDGDFDDFSPLQLPDGDLIFCSTRRGGFHRCGGGPCYVYTLARCGGDGSNPRPISFHETNEWFPTLMHDGRVLYTRWDYVDRDAVYYQQLWTTRQDGTDVQAFYGNNTFNPPGMWEPKSVPGSGKIIAVGGPHHAMSAGSVVLIDGSKDVDGVEPVTRLTPDVRYPEGESPLTYVPMPPFQADFDHVPASYWQAGRKAERAEQTPEERRWPTHCFKSPFPLAEKYFVASYSFDKLIGEAGPNIPNQFGIYYCDAFGNRELIYRDPNISSIWAIPVRKRPIPPTTASMLDETLANAEKPTGTFFLQNVYESWPYKIPAKIKSLRIVQVLPKTTPNANDPMIGVANASPGKQLLGTIPVEEDGSAFFEAPAKTPILFQALDENGRMVQGMRSLVYLQPGETASCVGCHEDRTTAVPSVKTIASTKKPAQIVPGPDGSKPLSFPILVQPILDRACVSCHNAEKAEGGIDLTGTLTERYTKSYEALTPFVPYTAWGNPEGNYEPRPEPDRFGSRPSKLTKLIEDGHYDVKLTPEEWERLNVWQDMNALFYGTFNPENQARQQRGERIEGPDLE